MARLFTTALLAALLAVGCGDSDSPPVEPDGGSGGQNTGSTGDDGGGSTGDDGGGSTGDDGGSTGDDGGDSNGDDGGSTGDDGGDSNGGTEPDDSPLPTPPGELERPPTGKSLPDFLRPPT